MELKAVGTKEGRRIKVWDPVVRVGHWLLVAGFFTAYFTEDDFLAIHVWAGYVVAAVIVFRILWGFIGSPNARFVNFVCSPVSALSYLANLCRHRAPRYLGHNPAGAAMILALLLSISVTAGSGLMIHAIEEGAGPLAALVKEGGTADSLRPATSRPGTEESERGAASAEQFWEELHEIFANLTLLLVAAHVAGVLLSSYLERENLVKAMITGRKTEQNEAHEAWD